MWFSHTNGADADSGEHLIGKFELANLDKYDHTLLS